MAVDTPAKIAIIGAGPIGLEAALYARFLGYEVEVFDANSSIAEDSKSWVQKRGERCFSELGVSALRAQHDDYRPPEHNDAIFHKYLLPLAESDLLADFIHLNTRVLAIGKVQLMRSDRPQDEFDRGAWDFRLLVQEGAEERVLTADVVLDCTGVRSLPLGHGGVPAVGENDVAGSDCIEYSGEGARPTAAQGEDSIVLIVGADSYVYNTMLLLAFPLFGSTPRHIIWLTQSTEADVFPVQQIGESVRSSHRTLITDLGHMTKLDWWEETWVESVKCCSDGRLEVTVAGNHDATLQLDRIYAHNGHRPAWWSELQLDICPITDAPRPFSEYLLKRPSPYSVEYPAPDPSALITSEPNYYVLGSKSFGRMPGFLFQHGLRQIRDVFTIIGDRADLDLYAQMK